MRSITAADDALLTTYGRLVEAHSSLAVQLGRSLELDAGVPLPWFEVLLRIGRAEGGRLSMGALGQQVALTSGGVTKLVDRMVEAGFVDRVPCPSDRRVAYATLTAQGETTLAQAATVHAENLRRVFAGFSEGDLRTVDALLDRLRDAVVE